MSPAIGRCAGKNAVIVLGKALRFHQCFTAAIRTGIKITVLRRLAIEGLDYILRPLSSEMDSTPPEVTNLLRMAESPARVLAVRLVAGIGARGRKAAPQVAGKSGVSDGTRKPTIAHTQIALVPILFRQPDFEAYIGVRRGTENAGTRQNGDSTCTGLFRPGRSRSPESMRRAEVMVVSGS